MQTPTCIHTFCTKDHSREPEDDFHEADMLGVTAKPNGPSDPSVVASQVTYRDGDRDPYLYLNAASVELTPDAVAQLIGNLTAQLDSLRAVNPTPLQVFR